MEKAEAEQATPAFIDKWVQATDQPMPPDGKYHYSFSSYWMWVENNYHTYTQFRAVPNARYVAEMWFDRIMKQAWRN